MDLIASLYDALAADATLTALLAEYGGSPSEPAIFSGDVIPVDFDIGADTKPALIVGPIVSQDDEDDFDGRQRVSVIDVRLYAKAAESASDIDAAAERARIVLHRQILPETGGEAPFCRVSGPVSAPTSSPEIAGRRLSARLYVKG